MLSDFCQAGSSQRSLGQFYSFSFFDWEVLVVSMIHTGLPTLTCWPETHATDAFHTLLHYMSYSHAMKNQFVTDKGRKRGRWQHTDRLLWQQSLSHLALHTGRQEWQWVTFQFILVWDSISVKLVHFMSGYSVTLPTAGVKVGINMVDQHPRPPLDIIETKPNRDIFMILHRFTNSITIIGNHKEVSVWNYSDIVTPACMVQRRRSDAAARRAADCLCAVSVLF